MKKPDKIETGRRGESLAAEAARSRQYRVVARNVRTAYGEIDLILEKAGQMVFAEVKTRSTFRFGYPEQAVDSAKLAHMIASAEAYIEENGLSCPWRLDVISILIDAQTGAAKELTWIENVTAES